jgi:hypothetical protein
MLLTSFSNQIVQPASVTRTPVYFGDYIVILYRSSSLLSITQSHYFIFLNKGINSSGWFISITQNKAFVKKVISTLVFSSHVVTCLCWHNSSKLSSFTYTIFD